MSNNTIGHINGLQPVEFEGKTYTFGEPTLAMFKEACDYARGKVVRETDALLNGVESPDFRDRLISKAEKQVAALVPASDAFANLCATDTDVGLYLFWVMIRANHPTVTRDDIAKMVVESGKTLVAQGKVAPDFLEQLKATKGNG